VDFLAASRVGWLVAEIVPKARVSLNSLHAGVDAEDSLVDRSVVEPLR